MQVVFVLLLFLFGLGLFAHKFNAWTRLLMVVGIGSMIVVITFTGLGG